MTTMEDILSRLDPKTRKRVQQATEVETEKQPTPSLSLNVGLKGGLGYGRQVLVWGNKSAGKSSFCLQLLHSEGTLPSIISVLILFNQSLFIYSSGVILLLLIQIY